MTREDALRLADDIWVKLHGALAPRKTHTALASAILAAVAERDREWRACIEEHGLDDLCRWPDDERPRRQSTNLDEEQAQ